MLTVTKIESSDDPLKRLWELDAIGIGSHQDHQKHPKTRTQLISLTVPVVLMVSDMNLLFLGRSIIHLLLTTMEKHIKDLSPLKEDLQRILRRRAECIVKQ